MAWLSLGGCGGDCNVWQSALGDPACKKLDLSGSRAFVGTKASCAGAANSRKLSVNCPSTAGTAAHCDASLNGASVFSILVSNNASGSFLDGDGTTYTNCQDLLVGYNNGNLVNVVGVYTSDASTPNDTVSCNSNGCTMTSANCYAGWKAGAFSGTANIPLTADVLACTYIDTAALGSSVPPISVRTWAAAPAQFTVGGDLAFTSSWGDAY